MNIELVDFDDSFTLNIASFLVKQGFSYRLINWRDWAQEREMAPLTLLGPGPGTVDEYRWTFPQIEKLLGMEGHFIMGICLGHQLIHSVLGYGMVPWGPPLHGQREKISFDFWPWLEGDGLEGEKGPPASFWEAQFYNSWGVQGGFGPSGQLYLDDRGRVLAGKGERYLSYQFHPESVGTTCPERLFAPLKKRGK